MELERYAIVRPYTVVSVRVDVKFFRELRGVGMARCSSSDRWDGDKGFAIAKGRAVDDIARQVAEMERDLGVYWYDDDDFELPRRDKSVPATFSGTLDPGFSISSGITDEVSIITKEESSKEHP